MDKSFLITTGNQHQYVYSCLLYTSGGDNVKAGKALFYYGKVMDLQGNDTLAMQAYLNALAKLEKTEEYKLKGLSLIHILTSNHSSSSG